ncbi:organic solute transporter Ostalpha-domain-containing protein [Xylariaceae sp. FL0255]|nr:organic solute transporter Ostalpha-domain-containing protein [Xylariaceae sp. FL0255]
MWNTTCNSTLENERISEVPIVHNLTFHQLTLIIGGATTIFAIIVSFYLIFQHATNYTRPREQRHIIRILFMVPIYAVSSFLCLMFYWKATYFQVISEAYEAFAIASFFALMCHYLAPNLHEQKQFFRQMQPIKHWIWPLPWFAKCCGGQRGIWRTPKSGLTWFNIAWTGVYQYCFIRVSLTIVSVITQHYNRYCESSDSPVFAHVWIIGIEGVAVTIAMYCIIQFYVQFREALAEQKLFLKVLAIKLVIFLSFWQTIVISLATSSSVNLVHTSSTLAYPDIKVGIPSLLLCIEMAMFAVLHLWSFPHAPYREGAKVAFYPSPNIGKGMPGSENPAGPKQGGFFGLKALVDAFNMWDIVKAFGRGIRWLFVGVKRRKEDVSYQLNSDTSYAGKDGAPAKSTDHLPIAHQFRRSTFEMTGSSEGPVPEESAGLIANAQPNPNNRHSRPESLENIHPALRPGYSIESDSGGSSRVGTVYAPYEDDRGDIGRAGPQYKAYDPDAYHFRTDVEAGRLNPRNSTQMKIGNAFWGHDQQQQQQQ